MLVQSAGARIVRNLRRVCLALSCTAASLYFTAIGGAQQPKEIPPLEAVRRQHETTVLLVSQLIDQVDSVIRELEQASAKAPDEIETHELLQSMQARRKSLVEMRSQLEKSAPPR